VQADRKRQGPAAFAEATARHGEAGIDVRDLPSGEAKPLEPLSPTLRTLGSMPHVLWPMPLLPPVFLLPSPYPLFLRFSRLEFTFFSISGISSTSGFKQTRLFKEYLLRGIFRSGLSISSIYCASTPSFEAFHPR
jgi:hypothetical protein